MATQQTILGELEIKTSEYQQLLQLLNQFFNFHRAYLLTQIAVQDAPGFRQPAINADGYCRTPARLLRGLPLGSMQCSTCLFG